MGEEFRTAEDVQKALQEDPNFLIRDKGADTVNDFKEFQYAKDLGIVEDFGDDFKALKTPEERNAYIKTKYSEKVQQKSYEDDDEFVKSYKERKKQADFDENKFIVEKARHFIKFEGKDANTILKEGLKESNDKYTDEEIDEYLGKLSTIQKDQMAKEYKQKYYESINTISQEDYNKSINDAIKSSDDNNILVDKLIGEYFEKQIKTGKYPLKIGESELESLKNDTMDFLKSKYVKDANGRVTFSTRLQNFLQDDAKMQIAAPILAMIDSGNFEKFITTMTTQVKDNEWNRIGSPGSNVGSSGSPKVMREEDFI